MPTIAKKLSAMKGLMGKNTANVLRDLPSEAVVVEKRKLPQKPGHHLLGYAPYWENFEATGDVMPKPSRPWKVFIDPEESAKYAAEEGLTPAQQQANNLYTILHEQEHLRNVPPEPEHFDEEAFLEYLSKLGK